MLANPQLQLEIPQVPVVLGTRTGFSEVDKTWMIIDLVDSTSWYVSLDKVTAFSLLRVCLERMGDVVKEYGGKVVKLTGDGLHACFDDPLKALLCAAAYQESIDSESDSSFCDCPKARIGLSVGSCVQCKICECVDYYGYAVFLAARLAQQGGCDEVVMSEEFTAKPEVANVLKNIDVETRLCNLKGFPQPVRCQHIDSGELYSWTRSASHDATISSQTAVLE